jgi:protein O-GlcNAc transferase
MTLDEAFALAVAHHQAGRLAEADHVYRAIVEAVPDHPESHHNLGLIALQCGRADLAPPLLEAALALRPDYPEAHYNLALALQSLGRADEAVGHYRRAIALNPADVLARNNLGNILKQWGLLDEAAACFRQVLALRPDHPEAHSNLAMTVLDQGETEAALTLLDRALALRPDYPEAHYNRAIVLERLGRPDEAEAANRRALALRPDYAEAHLNLANIQMPKGEIDEARTHAERAIAIRPDHAMAHNTLGNILETLGRFDDAAAHLRRALEIDPTYVNAHRNLLASTLYQPSWTPEQRFAEHRRFEARHAQPLYPDAVSFDNSRDPGRRLRIGYLSSDLWNHPVGRNLLPLIEAHDRSKVELAFYAHVIRPDATTRRFQSLADLWRPVQGLSDGAVADLIRADAIDVLVVLAGRFDRNRPLVAAHRPAPVQISFHDPATSGMEVMDAIITDRVMTPRHGTELFAERPLRLPSFYLHDPIAEAPPVAPPPMLRNGHPTFGSFNNPAKLSDQTLALWAGVLRAIPGSRLRLKYKTWFAAPGLVRRVLDVMAGHGVAPERIELPGASEDTRAHLSQYDAIDIALDPFPFNGSTTTFEALWMGVPVVTLAGETMVSRWSASMLTTLRLTGLIAASPADYVDICQRLVSDPAALAGLRAGLRDRVAASPLCNSGLKARHLERAYGALWRRWCSR